MTRPFKELRDRMDPEARARAEQETERIVTFLAYTDGREDRLYLDGQPVSDADLESMQEAIRGGMSFMQWVRGRGK